MGSWVGGKFDWRNLLTWLREEFTFFRESISIVSLQLCSTNSGGSVRAYKLLLIISVWLSHILSLILAFHSQECLLSKLFVSQSFFHGTPQHFNTSKKSVLENEIKRIFYSFLKFNWKFLLLASSKIAKHEQILLIHKQTFSENHFPFRPPSSSLIVLFPFLYIHFYYLFARSCSSCVMKVRELPFLLENSCSVLYRRTFIISFSFSSNLLLNSLLSSFLSIQYIYLWKIYTRLCIDRFILYAFKWIVSLFTSLHLVCQIQ